MPNVKPARNGVFISYARSDGEQFANLLSLRLQKENIPLWQDRVGMEGGRDWWLQITEALDQVEFMALVITPNALKSETVRKEWRYARQQGVGATIVSASDDLTVKVWDGRCGTERFTVIRNFKCVELCDKCRWSDHRFRIFGWKADSVGWAQRRQTFYPERPQGLGMGLCGERGCFDDRLGFV